MLSNLKALAVVLVLALAVFYFGRPVCLAFMSEEAFKRRRNAWLALTVVAFISPTFWLFALVELGVVIWLYRKDENPLALYVFLTFTVPNIGFFIPVPIFNQFFQLTQYRLLSLAILLPMAVRAYKIGSKGSSSRFGIVDALMLGFVAIQIVLLIPYESFTNTLRRSFLITLDVFLVVYAFQRVESKEKLAEILACFWMSVALMAPIGVFESFKGWLLYTGLGFMWGDPNVFSFIYRGNILRAQAAAGHSLYLGYELAAGLGVFLFLWRPQFGRFLGWMVALVFGGALIATGSRGAWITAFIATALFVALRPHAGRRLTGAALLGVLALTLMYFSPLKESVIDRLPVIGNTDQDTIQYRQRLFDVSWLLIKQNPFFGDPFVANQMESLRQGQGIIDIVNGYLFIALFHGLVPLALLVAAFIIALVRGLRVTRSKGQTSGEFAGMGPALLAVWAATMFYIGTGGIISPHYLFLALLCSYWRLLGSPAVLPQLPQKFGSRVFH